MIFLVTSAVSSLLSVPSLAIAYRRELQLHFFSERNSNLFRLIKNKFFGSVFNMTSTALFLIRGEPRNVNIFNNISSALSLPLAVGATACALAGLETELVCVLRPVLGISNMSVSIITFLSLLYKYCSTDNWIKYV